MARGIGAALALTLGLAAAVNAQDAPGSPVAETTRPATTTFFGDTGLWFVPTAEVLPHGQWSGSGYRRGTNYIQGYTNVGDFAGTFAYGIKGRAEVFGSFLVDTRIDRDVRPLFLNDPAYGGFVDRYPRVNTTWTGDNLGDFYVGVKLNLWSEAQRKPAALAVRGIVKLPTASTDVGNGTGQADFLADFIVSKEVRLAELSGYAGFEMRGSPDDFSIPGGAFRWGAGAGFPSRGPLRVSAELNGIANSSGTASTTTTLRAVDGTVSPLVVNTENITRATAAVTYQARKGFFVGAGLSWNVPRQERLTGHADADDYPFGDYWDWQVRIGYHPGVRKYVPPPPPAPQSAPPAPAPQAAAPPHLLSVKAQCDPCTVETEQRSTVSATVQDSIGCAVTYRWTAPSGTFAAPTERQAAWTAPNQAGTLPVTVTVTCPSDNKTASDTVNIVVTRPPVKTYTFDDVYFDFDRYSLRPEAGRVLEEAIGALRQDPALRIQIDGHTCSIGTAEYNLALGERRANAVREYLVSRGVPADRLTSVSYGEEAPKFDNGREETRRLNRRAALVVNLRR